ncbi:MAG TPA: hypothetical protein VK934_10635 [Fimbriimonas sp.]|nr:hypothetical protein [Fimbriimonas sp.]
MNEREFDSALKEAMVAKVATSRLDRKIDSALDRVRAGGRWRLRVWTLSGAVGALAFAVLLVPPMQAQATIARLQGALEGVRSLRVKKFSIDENGNLAENGFVAYSAGHWRMENANGAGKTYLLNGKQVSYDPLMRVFVANETRSQMQSLRLRDLMGSLGGFDIKRRVSQRNLQVQGRAAIEATIEYGLPERLVVLADASTQLPIESRLESLELGKWRAREVSIFDYAAKFAPGFFEMPKGVPIVDRKELAKRMVDSMTRRQLASVPLDKGKLIIRAVDVAQDGTVFVAFQSGFKKARSWKGSTFRLTDDIGSAYQLLPHGGEGSLDEEFIARTQDGKMELEVFVPVAPMINWTPRVVKLSASLYADGSLVRWVPSSMTLPDGSAGPERLVPNIYRVDGNNPMTSRTVLSHPVKEATCGDAPLYASMLNRTNFGSKTAAQITTAGARATFAMEKAHWKDARFWLNEKLRFMREHERLGLGSYSLGQTLENLRTVEGRMKP